MWYSTGPALSAMILGGIARASSLRSSVALVGLGVALWSTAITQSAIG